MTEMTTRTREQIEAEKRTKPRPDLLPVRGVLAICREAPAGHMLFSLLAAQGSDEKVEHLAAAGRAIASELGGTAAALLKAGEVMGYGFRKHGRCTWRVAGTEQADPQTHYASAVRHVLERIENPDASEEGSGKPVLYHALAQIIIAIDLLENPPKIEGENDGAGML